MQDLKDTLIQTAEGAFIVKNDKGLHTRPSTELVKCATGFRASVRLYYRDYAVNGKSLLGILMMAAERGAKIRVEAAGVDAEDAVRSIVSLANRKFNINY